MAAVAHDKGDQKGQHIGQQRRHARAAYQQQNHQQMRGSGRAAHGNELQALRQPAQAMGQGSDQQAQDSGGMGATGAGAVADAGTNAAAAGSLVTGLRSSFWATTYSGRRLTSS